MAMNGKFLRGFFTGAALTLIVGTSAYVVKEHTEADGLLVDREHIEKLEQIEGMIDRYYLREPEEEKLADGMYAGLLNGLDDPYSCYYTEEEYKAMSEETSGHYNGIGVVMQKSEEGLIRLVRIYEGAPGEKAGLRAGDVLYQVDGTDVTGLELDQVAAKIKNPAAKVTKLTVVREGEKDYLNFEIQKEDVQIPVVVHEMLADRVGYLAIYEFTSKTAEQFRTAYADLEQQGMERLVIDLRDNPGGLLDSVCEILDSILPRGIIVYTEDKYGMRDERTSAGNSPIEIPLAVLVNENSASASEIFAGAVQDYGVGTIVGTSTFGKGVVQNVRTLADGSAVKLTISNYFTPNGNNIDGKGITPDVKVELDESLKQQNSVEPEEDNQLQKAVEVLLAEQ